MIIIFSIIVVNYVIFYYDDSILQYAVLLLYIFSVGMYVLLVQSMCIVCIIIIFAFRCFSIIFYL